MSSVYSPKTENYHGVNFLVIDDDVIKYKQFPRYWPPVTDEFPAQRPVTQSFNVFFYLRLNKRLSKQSWGWWFETPSRHYEVIVITVGELRSALCTTRSVPRHFLDVRWMLQRYLLDVRITSNHPQLGYFYSLFGLTKKTHIKDSYYWPFKGGILRSPMDSPHKGPVMRHPVSSVLFVLM